MQFLLDTHVWLWHVLRPDRIGKRAMAQINDGNNVVFLSAASVWETAIKIRAGKLRLPISLEKLVTEAWREDRYDPLAVEYRHVLRVESLPDYHADPFDHILIAQAAVENIPIMTVDEQFKDYPIKVIPADR